MKKVVIVGAGPAGLYFAILLRQLGIENIIVIDPRAGEYTRPGLLEKEVFKKLEKNIGHAFSPSRAHHIKEAERKLEEIATLLGIKIEKKTFIRFGKKSVWVKAKNKEEEINDCDLVIDASGENRVCAQSINEKIPGTFTIEPIYPVSVKRHLLAYVGMLPDDVKSLRDSENIKFVDDLMYVETLEKLRDEFGWKKYSYPYLKNFILPKNKVCFYCEIPDDLKAHQYESWLKSLIRFKTDNPKINFHYLKSSQKYSHKPRFNAFTVNPTKILEPFFVGNDELPMVLLTGDALISAEYRKGTGIMNAIEMINACKKAITMIEDSTFSINLAAYQMQLNEIVKAHEDEIIRFHRVRDRQFDFDENNHTDFYAVAISKTESEPEKQQLIQKRDALCLTLAHKKHTQAAQAWRAAFTPQGEFVFDQFGFLENKDSLTQCAKLLIETLSLLPQPHSQEYIIKNDLKNVAYKFIALGAKYFNSNNHITSLQFYNKAHDIFDNYLFKECPMEILDSKLNCIILEMKLFRYKNVIDSVNQMMLRFNDFNFPGKEKYFTKFQYYKVITELNVFLVRFKQSLPQLFAHDSTILNKYAEIQQQLLASPHILPNEKFVLTDLINKVLNSFNPFHNNTVGPLL